MALINYATREINAKIVYYGPGLSGKTTNIQYVFKKVKPDNKGKLISLATKGDRTLFFDFLPVELGTIKGFRTRFHLYTVPGQVFYNSTRKMVLKGSDGVVFVADSQKMMMEENMQSLENLKSNLRDMGLSYETFPVVMQFNKRDLPNAAPVEEIDRFLNPTGLPYFSASAISGDGVLKTLTAIVKYVLHDLNETPHAHSLDFGAIETAAAMMAEGESPLFVDTPEVPGVRPEIRALAEDDAAKADSEAEPAAQSYEEEESRPLEQPGAQEELVEETASEDVEEEPETMEVTAEDAGGEEVELPVASPEFFGAFDSVPYLGEHKEEVFEAEEVIDGLCDMIAEPEEGPGLVNPLADNDEQEFSPGEIETFSSIASYDTFPAPAADTLHEVLEDYPSDVQEETKAGEGADEAITENFNPDIDVDLTTGLDMPSLVDTGVEARGEADETRPGVKPEAGGARDKAGSVMRIKKSFRLPVRFSTKAGDREVELKLNVDLGITGEGLDAVELVEILEPRPEQPEPKAASMHEKDPSKHPPPKPPAVTRKNTEITEPIIRMRKKSVFEKMFGR